MLSVGRCGVARLQMKFGNMDGMHCIIDSTSILVKIKSVALYNCRTVYIGLHVKYQLFLSDFNETWIFSKDFLKILKYQISWKSVQWQPSCSMQTDGQTDATNLIIAFRNFANAPENCSVNRQQNGGFLQFHELLARCITFYIWRKTPVNKAVVVSISILNSLIFTKHKKKTGSHTSEFIIILGDGALNIKLTSY